MGVGARDAADVVRLAASATSIEQVGERVAGCFACPRLVQWREQVARERRRAFVDQTYWGRAVPGFGDPGARIAVVGLAPAAHGANRTGRMFTGDRSGEWLYAALHRAGLANQPVAVSAADGLRLTDVYISAPVHCAPPANRPTTTERDTCRPWLARELQLLWPRLRVIVVLGGFGWAALWPALRAAGIEVPGRLAAFGHGVEQEVGSVTVLGCYHVSQQNTFTGRLTAAMLDTIFARAKSLASLEI